MNRLALSGALPEDLAQRLRAAGTPVSDAEARRALAHTWRHPGQPWSSMRRPVRLALREALDICTERRPLRVVERVDDPIDGARRYVLRADDGALFEAVRIPLERAGRFSVCLSSQVGCAMRCDFCATGRLGLARDLAAWEMVESFRVVADEAPGAVTGAVFMGQGEPLHNYDEVMQAAAVLSHPCAGRVSADAITISTVGLVPQIRRYAAERRPYRLIVSLHSALPARRAALAPVAGRASLDELSAALRALHEARGDRVTIAWVLLGGVNTGPDEVEALRALLGDLPIRLNLIDVNDARPDGYRRADDAERGAFLDALRALGAPVVRRYSVGAAQDAACGMLAARTATRGAAATLSAAGRAPAAPPPTGDPPPG